MKYKQKKSELARWRYARGLTLREIAEATGVDTSTVHYWEVRGISPPYLRKVSEVTGIPTRKLRPDLAELFD